jgi:hypothetical protein
MVDIVTIPPTFTPASSCLGSSNIWEIVLGTSVCTPNDPISPCPAYLLQGPITSSDCLPPSYVPWRKSSLVYQGSCPQGYWTACTSESTAYTSTVIFGICCPRFVLPLPFIFRIRNNIDNTTSSFKCQFTSSIPFQTTLGCFTEFTATETVPVTVSHTGIPSLGFTVAYPQAAVNAYSIVIQISDSATTSSNKENIPGVLL